MRSKIFPAFLIRIACALPVLLLLALAAKPAAACTFTPPVGHTNQNGDGVTVNWGFTCNSAPPVIVLIQGAKTWGQKTNNPSGDIVGTITNNLAPMMPSTPYTGMQICGGASAAKLQYCSGTFTVATGPSGAQPGSNPKLTGLSVAPGAKPGTYVFSWTPSSAYTVYAAAYNQDVGQQQVTNASATFTLDYGTQYSFMVEGGVFSGGFDSINWSGVWATVNYTTPPAPVPPTLPPTGLQGTYEAPSSVRAANIYVGWTDPVQSGVSDVPPTRSPSWSGPPAINITNNFHSFYDFAIAGNTRYTYNICLKGANGAPCVPISVSVPAIPPSCTQKLTCPAASGVPGTILYSCNAAVDFYESPTGSMSNATPLPNDTPTTYSGTDQVINPTYLLFCQKGSKTVCGSLPQFMPVTSCPTPLPPPKQPPAKNCQVCTSTGRQCKAVPGGVQCVGLAQ